MPVQNPNPMAKIGPWKLEGRSPTITSPLLAQAVVQTCCSPPWVPCPPGQTGSAIWAPAIMCVRRCVRCVCVCVFGLSSAWLLQPPAQGTGGNTRLISSSLEPRHCTVWTNTHIHIYAPPHTRDTASRSSKCSQNDKDQVTKDPKKVKEKWDLNRCKHCWCVDSNEPWTTSWDKDLRTPSWGLTGNYNSGSPAVYITWTVLWRTQELLPLRNKATLALLALSFSSTQTYLSLLALTPRLSPPLPPLVSAVSLTPWA